MYGAGYLTTLKPGRLLRYCRYWKQLADYMTATRGAISSTFYASDNESRVLIYSQWPNYRSKQQAWPLPDNADERLRKTSELMADCRKENTSTENLQIGPDGLETLLSSEGINPEPLEQVVTPRKKILIYNDEGCAESTYDIIRMLQEITDLSQVRILIVDSDYVNSMDWQDKTRLFIMPGGRARPYYSQLGAAWQADEVPAGTMRRLKMAGKGNEKIKQFVEEFGGHYLGICAGGYYGASLTKFEHGGRHEVLDEGALKFYPGIAEGPAYGLNKFEYDSYAGYENAVISSHRLPGLEALNVYFNGGCYFHDGGDAYAVSRATVLANYNNIPPDKAIDDSASIVAVIENTIGHGKAILSGVHFEILSNSPDLDPETVTHLVKHDEPRLRFAAQLLSRLNIPLNPKYYDLVFASEVNVRDISPCVDLKIEHEHFEITESTQTYSKEPAQLQKLKSGQWLIVSAEKQTHGKGTKKRDWASPEGNLFVTFSTLLDQANTDPRQTRHIPQMVALSVVQVLEKYGLSPKLKWVNDVLINEKKISGILCETSVIGTSVAIHIGIGVNVNLCQQVCDRISQPATSMSLALGGRLVNKDNVLALLTQLLNKNFTLFQAHGFGCFLNKIEHYLAFRGETVVFDTESSDHSDPLIAQVVGVDEQGGLVLRTSNGDKIFYTGRILRGKELKQHQKLLQRENANTYCVDDKNETSLAAQIAAQRDIPEETSTVDSKAEQPDDNPTKDLGF